MAQARPEPHCHLRGKNRDIMTERLDFNNRSAHPFGAWVTNEEQNIGVTGHMRVAATCPPEEKASVEKWLDVSGTATAWRETWDKSNSYTDTRT